jgi:hypothetical protein
MISCVYNRFLNVEHFFVIYDKMRKFQIATKPVGFEFTAEQEQGWLSWNDKFHKIVIVKRQISQEINE